jgi:hypothetical protein
MPHNPETPVYGFPYENVEGEPEPGSSLHGGTLGNHDILAQAVEDELIRIETDVAEAGAAYLQSGWHDITPSTGVLIEGNTTFNVPIGKFNLVRVYCRGNLTEEGILLCRVNVDTTPGLHRYGRSTFRYSPGNSIRATADTNSGFAMAIWGPPSSGFNTATAILYRTNITARIGYQAWGNRVSPNTNLRARTTVDGDLAEARLLDAINIRTSSSLDEEINTCRVWIEGHVA